MKTLIKDLIKLVVYKFFEFNLRPKREIRPKTLLLIRLDGIGDYVLFRNYIQILAESQKYKDYSITLLGNRAWKGLSEELDQKFIDNFIWIDTSKFTKNLIYRYRKLREIVSKTYEIIVNPTFSRQYFLDDNISKLVNAKTKISNHGDLSNIKMWQRKISNKYYNTLIEVDDRLMFEFNRNRDFFEALIKRELQISKPYISHERNCTTLELPTKYIILSIGAGSCSRKWTINNYAELGSFINEKYGYDIVLCGGTDDIEDAKKFKNYYNKSFKDLVGQISLVDYLYVIKNACYMISNESSSPHLAMAVGMNNVFVIANGNNYGRFSPYPNNIKGSYYAIFHPSIVQNQHKFQSISHNSASASLYDIQEITIDAVKKVLDDKLVNCEDNIKYD